MPTLAERIRFAETYVANKEGVPWSLAGREWVRDEFWRAATGFKLWRPKTGGDLCGECMAKAGSVIEHPADNDTRTTEHQATGCPGLDVFPLLVIGLNLKRQDGKTFNTMAFAMAEMALNRNVSIALTAASEDQAKAIFDENYKLAVERNKKLEKHFRIVGLRIFADKRNGLLEAMATSSKSATGRTRRYVLIDEAKDVPDSVADAVIHAIQAMSGIQCPFGHVSRLDAAAADAALNNPTRETCPTCGQRLEPFFGRIIATSSSGIIDDASRSQWFGQLVARQLGISSGEFGEELPPPSPYVHVFASDAPLNPAKSDAMQEGIRSAIGELPAMRELVEAAMGSRWVRKGEEFVTKSELERVIDRRLVSLIECKAAAVGFLDTSLTTDKTSLVVLASDAERALSEDPWSHVFVARLDVWEPAKSGGLIDEREVKAHVEKLLPRFTGLRALYVDTRGMPWAMRLVKELHSSRVKPWDKATAHESVAGWGELRKRIRALTIRLPNSDLMRREFRGVHLKQSKDGMARAEDRDRKKSHKDITEALALCCYLVAIEAMKPKRSIADMMKRQAGGERRESRGTILVGGEREKSERFDY